jgi:hypothetical protein
MAMSTTTTVMNAEQVSSYDDIGLSRIRSNLMLGQAGVDLCDLFGTMKLEGSWPSPKRGPVSIPSIIDDRS